MDLRELTCYTEYLFASTLELKMSLLLTAGTSHSFLSLSMER